MKETNRILTKGLQDGFAGRTEKKQVMRGVFPMTVSQLEVDGTVYHDEWFADRVGGGQEIVMVGDGEYTRLYAGGVVNAERLSELNLTKKEIINYLKSKIQELGGATRLHESCPEQIDDDWSYRYQVTEKISELPLTVGRESIDFKGNEVFVHVFLLCPVE